MICDGSRCSRIIRAGWPFTTCPYCFQEQHMHHHDGHELVETAIDNYPVDAAIDRLVDREIAARPSVTA